MKEILIQLDNVGVCYNTKGSLTTLKKQTKTWVLEDISLKIYRGEVLGVVGKNGAGKSTLLSLLAGIIALDKGALINKAKQVSLLSLQVGFVGYLTGRQNIYLSGLLLGISKKNLREKIQEIIDFSELDHFIEAKVETYSSGMKARLGFSISICLNPDVILIDEILGVGDRSFKNKSSKYIREKIKSSSTTAVIVSHNQATIEELCDRAIYIEEGKVAREGTVEEVYLCYQ